ncbi:MAG: hypothetical protein BWK76_17695, partial [Desulfobulbaceae bacterium A2]
MEAALKVTRDAPDTAKALLDLHQSFVAGGKSVDTTAWRQTVEKYDAALQDITKDNGWYDLFLIHEDGNVVY